MTTCPICSLQYDDSDCITNPHSICECRDHLKSELDQLRSEIKAAYDKGYQDRKAEIVTWLLQAPERVQKQAMQGAMPLHYMHVSGLLDTCEQIAKAIETETYKL